MIEKKRIYKCGVSIRLDCRSTLFRVSEGLSHFHTFMAQIGFLFSPTHSNRFEWCVTIILNGWLAGRVRSLYRIIIMIITAIIISYIYVDYLMFRFYILWQNAVMCNIV